MELATYLPYLVNRVGQRFIADFTPVLAARGVDIQSWRVLFALYQQGDRTVGALSALTSINFSTLSRLIGRMEKKGLVRRERAGDDARAVRVSLTGAGRRTTEEIVPEAAALEARAAAGFSEAELAMLRQLLVKLYTGLAEGEGEADARLTG